jgi:tetratricopeptide (TPR) repeat protein
MAVSTALALAPLFPAWAQNGQQIDWCDGTHSATPELSIGGCTAMFRSGDFNNRVVAYFEDGQSERATQDYDQAIRLRPNFFNALSNYGFAPLSVNNYGAVPDGQRAIHPAPLEESGAFGLPAEVTEMLVKRGGELLSTGDIVAARLAFERVAASGNKVAATAVAKTYDPLFLAQTGVRGLRGDPSRAALWYGKAAAAGDREAQQRLRRLRVQFPQ